MVQESCEPVNAVQQINYPSGWMPKFKVVWQKYLKKW